MDLSENNRSESRLRPLVAEDELRPKGMRIISHLRTRARHRSASGEEVALVGVALALSCAFVLSTSAQVNSNQLPSQLFIGPSQTRANGPIGTRAISPIGLKRSLATGEEAFVMVSRGESAGRLVTDVGGGGTSNSNGEESEEAPEVATELAPTVTAADGTTLEEAATATMAPATLGAPPTTQCATDAITGVTSQQVDAVADLSSASSGTAPTQETGASQAEAADDRISIDENRKHFVTHDQLTSATAQHLTARTKDEHIDLQAVASSDEPQSVAPVASVAPGLLRAPTSRAGISKVSHVSSFLSGKY